MAVPLDGIRAIHNAFRRDITVIDAAAYDAARGQGNLDTVVKRYAFFGEILAWHASGEEESVFPALDEVAPLVAEPYEQDHRGLDSLYESLKKAIDDSDILAVARTTAAFKFHLSFHLNKEETHLYRIFNERISLSNQGAIIGKIAQKVPQERLPELVAWEYPLIGTDDRENMVRIMQQVLPEAVFAGVTKLIHAAIGDDWEELTRRIPGLK